MSPCPARWCRAYDASANASSSTLARRAVAVQLPGCYDGAVIQAAVALCGAVLLPVVMIYGTREMDLLLRRSGAAAVVGARRGRSSGCGPS